MTQYSDVKTVCDKLHQQGTPVTFKLLLAFFDDDRACLFDHYRQWRQERNSQGHHGSDGFILSEQFMLAMKAQCQDYTNAHVLPLKADLKKVTQSNQPVQQSLKKLRQHIEKLNRDIKKLTSERDQLAQQVSRQKTHHPS